jgi:hypothetical protein
MPDQTPRRPMPPPQAPTHPQQSEAVMAPRSPLGPQLGAQLREPMMQPTSWEAHLAVLAARANETKPALYNIRSKNAKAPRVVHDYHGNKVSIAPGTSKESILLHPNVAEQLGKSDLEFTVA